MSNRPKLRLSRLRDIGWSLWDPIGLNDFDGQWESVDVADEYDSYLIHVAGMLRNGEPEEDAVDYLVRVETEIMGLSLRPGLREHAKTVITAIKNDKSLWTIPPN